jgi:hypothetical protein
MDIFTRKPKNVDEQQGEALDGLDDGGMIAENSSTEKRQKRILYGGGGLIGIAAMWWVLGGDDKEAKLADKDEKDKVEVSTDAIMNRQLADRDWMTMYDHQQTAQTNQLKGVQSAVTKVDQVQSELQALRQENEQMKADATRVLDANEAFARKNGFAGTPVIVRSDGAVVHGYRPRDFLESWLKGAS